MTHHHKLIATNHPPTETHLRPVPPPELELLVNVCTITFFDQRYQNLNGKKVEGQHQWSVSDDIAAIERIVTQHHTTLVSETQIQDPDFLIGLICYEKMCIAKGKQSPDMALYLEAAYTHFKRAWETDRENIHYTRYFGFVGGVDLILNHTK